MGVLHRNSRSVSGSRTLMEAVTDSNKIRREEGPHTKGSGLGGDEKTKCFAFPS